MPRPKTYRCTLFKPNVIYFKPRGVPLRQLDEIVLLADELEALKLHEVDGYDHIEAAKKMQVSQPTFGRIINAAYKKTALALTKGLAIRLEQKDQSKKLSSGKSVT